MAELELGQSDSGMQERQQGRFFRKAAPLPHIRITDISADVNALTERIRVLEDHANNLRKKVQLTDQSVLEHSKRMTAEMRLLNTDISQLSRSIDEIKERVRLIVKELQECAKKDDVAVLQKYINFWEPVNFVTQSQLSKILDEYVRKGQEQ